MRRKKIDLPSLFWRDIEGYEGYYQVSIDGDVKSLDRWANGKEKILKSKIGSSGYLLVGLRKDGKSKSFLVHRLVAQAWIPNPDNLPCVNHKDENPSNNRVENLEWCTYEYNLNYGTAQQRRAEKQSKAVVGIKPDTGEVVAEFPSAAEAGRNGYQDVSRCCLGKSKTCKGLIWYYKGTSDEEINRRIAEYRHNEEITKPVVALDMLGRIIHAFSSTAEAGRNGYNQGNVVSCCRGKLKTYKGLIWQYQDDFLQNVC